MSIETDAAHTPGGLAFPAGNLRGPLAFAIGCFLIWGLAYGLLDVLNKHFQETLSISQADSSWLQIAYFGAYLLLSLPAGMLLNARGYKFGIVSGLGLTAIGALLFIPAADAGSFLPFVGSMFVLAAGLCVLETSADTYVNVLGDPAKASQRLNLAQSFNALGVFIGPMIGGAVFFSPSTTEALGGATRSIQIVYGLIAVAVLVFAAVVWRARLPETGLSDHGAAVDGDAPAKPLSQQPHFIAGVVTQALYIGAQVGIGAYFINLVTHNWAGLSSQQGAFMLSLAAIGYLVGRFAATALLLKVKPRTLLTTYGVINVILTLIVAAGIDKVSPIALIAVFFFMSTMFATIFALGTTGLGVHTKKASSLMVMAIGGGVLLPWPMGKLADLYGANIAFLLPAACFVVVAWYGWKGAGLGLKTEAN
ncbi:MULTISPECIES: sugar MFS transporter [unclassified Brevundimonas]|uniref:sugar MFS transporter n=1 Tax=unclassified Brevundimonas TaxID=2622653 RepID=UPI000CFAAF3A|nr:MULTISPECIES: sugar MFS transporter [unclassified Brevundimonas]PRA22538.1 glucose/galactose MFS transporter [Brevundimonas sp. MYb27]PQZ77415.1 glucose/galactose MFS transporter [Brevundimonas sp. MYb31]PRB13210.1 glucose/galactose MFS transporter [Brevundimonas sp. MYb52]PRB33836.1 glucose/galactose MFS transporter [Brevundimonas sp. MYb46]PRB41769.1 glucose/galactose MFS transporter [Brevundimonas sp. MYb33]